MAIINNLPYSMEQDRIEQVKANSVHVDDNFNTLLNAVNNKIDKDGTMTITGDIPMNSHKITTLATPTASGDAATKGYVDTAITNASAPATTSTPGHVIVGANINVDATGEISVPLATISNPGVVQVGSALNVDGSGVLSANDATTSQKGVVQLGKADTSANAAVIAVRTCSITNSIPTTGTDGVIYFVYSA